MDELNHSFRQLARALRELSSGLQALGGALEAEMERRRRLYAAAGRPFGDSDEALAAWWKYAQRTTQN